MYRINNMHLLVKIVGPERRRTGYLATDLHTGDMQCSMAEPHQVSVNSPHLPASQTGDGAQVTERLIAVRQKQVGV